MAKNKGVTGMGIEYEHKYRATPQILDRLEQSLHLPGTVIRMETTYYGTPDQAYSARHWTVRRRMENERSVCTFKYPVDDIGRGEIEVESPSLESAIPALCKLSGQEELAQLAQAGLVPVCGARFTRTAVALTFGNTLLELALDRGVLLGGGKEQPLYEIEVELKPGSRESVIAFAQVLAKTYGLQKEEKSTVAARHPCLWVKKKGNFTRKKV